MRRLLQFAYPLRHFFLFLSLETAAFYLSFQYSNYHKTLFFGLAAEVNGYILSKKERLTAFFRLEAENRSLSAENARLRGQLRASQYRAAGQPTVVDDSSYRQQYTFIPAEIIDISIRSRDNTILIDRGRKQGVAENMGVVAEGGVVGIIDAVSSHYAHVIPIISSSSHVCARLKKSHFFAFLSWDGRDYRIVQLEEIPDHAPISPGDTVISDSHSAIFPAGVPIGTIRKIERDRLRGFYAADVDLFIDFARLHRVYVVKNLLKAEVNKVLNPSADE